MRLGRRTLGRYSSTPDTSVRQPSPTDTEVLPVVDGDGNGDGEPTGSHFDETHHGLKSNRSRRAGRAAIRAGATVLVMFVVAVIGVSAAYAVDMRNHRGKVARNVVVAGIPMGGLTAAQTATALAKLDTSVAKTSVKIVTPQDTIALPANRIALKINTTETAKAALAVRRTGFYPSRIVSWAVGYRKPLHVRAVVDADDDALWHILATEDKGPHKAPDEPGIREATGSLEVRPGVAGTGIDPRAVRRELGKAIEANSHAISIPRDVVAPRYNDAAATKLLPVATRALNDTLSVQAQGATVTLPRARLQSWIRAEGRGGLLVLGVDGEEMQKSLTSLLPKGKSAVSAHFEVVGGQVSIVAGDTGTKCCAPSTVTDIETALLKPGDDIVNAPYVNVEPEDTPAELQTLHVVEPVSSFTTNHPGGAPRVSNIHRIADLVRGTVIKPGETYSINKAVGPRTVAKGFVAAPVIEDGKFAESIGGGISQFATTTFNAALFAGIAIPHYQSHSIYISRYPYGREATLSFPAPDLKIKNTTDNGILIWPTYTGTSITVTFYSTKEFVGEQTGQTEGPAGACKLVRTQRTVTDLRDGSKKVDEFHARYRPAEGINC